MIISTPLLIECIIVGIQVLVISVIIRGVLKYFGIDIENKYVLFFIVGAFVHYISEMTGLNKKYCKDGFACKNL